MPEVVPPMPAVRRIVLVGLMGSGKTTVGRLLARALEWPLSDSDASIEAWTGRTVGELRDEIGVDAMHALEHRHLLEALAEQGPGVVTPAASIIDSDECRHALRAPEIAVVWLTASPGVAATRFVTGSHRPRYGDDPERFLARQAVARGPLFRSLGPIELSTDGRDPDAVAAAVLAALGPRGLRVGDEPFGAR